MSGKDADGVDQMPVGDCPNCGVIADEAVNWNFPAPATCALCEVELNVAAMATPEEIQEYA